MVLADGDLALQFGDHHIGELDSGAGVHAAEPGLVFFGFEVEQLLDVDLRYRATRLQKRDHLELAVHEELGSPRPHTVTSPVGSDQFVSGLRAARERQRPIRIICPVLRDDIAT